MRPWPSSSCRLGKACFRARGPSTQNLPTSSPGGLDAAKRRRGTPAALDARTSSIPVDPYDRSGGRRSAGGQARRHARSAGCRTGAWSARDRRACAGSIRGRRPGGRLRGAAPAARRGPTFARAPGQARRSSLHHAPCTPTRAGETSIPQRMAPVVSGLSFPEGAVTSSTTPPAASTLPTTSAAVAPFPNRLA